MTIKKTKDGKGLCINLDIGDGGALVSVTYDDRGTCLTIESHAFGNLVSTTKIFTNREGIAALALLFNQSVEELSFNKEYCYPAKPYYERSEEAHSDSAEASDEALQPNPNWVHGRVVETGPDA